MITRTSTTLGRVWTLPSEMSESLAVETLLEFFDWSSDMEQTIFDKHHSELQCMIKVIICFKLQLHSFWIPEACSRNNTFNEHGDSRNIEITVHFYNIYALGNYNLSPNFHTIRYCSHYRQCRVFIKHMMPTTSPFEGLTICFILSAWPSCFRKSHLFVRFCTLILSRIFESTTGLEGDGWAGVNGHITGHELCTCFLVFRLQN